jgi:hypothetical protein
MYLETVISLMTNLGINPSPVSSKSLPIPPGDRVGLDED